MGYYVEIKNDERFKGYCVGEDYTDAYEVLPREHSVIIYFGKDYINKHAFANIHGSTNRYGHINKYGYIKPGDEIKSTFVDKDELNLSGTYIRNIDFHMLLKKTDFKKISFISCFFDGDIDFSNIDFDGIDINFSNSIFGKGNRNFSGIKFGRGNVKFYETLFEKGNLDFSNTIFDKGDVDFRRLYVIEGDTIFSNAIFGDGSIDFTDAKFEKGNVSFSKVKFGRGNVNFLATEFKSGNVDFSRAEFGQGNIDFSEILIKNGEINFTGTKFNEGNVDFFAAELLNGKVSFFKSCFGKGEILFSSTNFGKGDVDFSYVNFGEGDTTFLSTRFEEGDIDFTGAKFEKGNLSFKNAYMGDGDVHFAEAKFGNCNVDFSHAIFEKGEISFYRAQFGEGDVDFKDVYFGDGDVDYIEVDFGEKRVDFSDSIFGKGTVDFTGAVFDKNSIDFTNTVGYVFEFRENRFMGIDSFQNMKCEKLMIYNCIIDKTLDLSGIDIKKLDIRETKNLGQIFIDWRKSNLDKTIIKKDQTITYLDVAYQYRLLKENFSKIGQYEDEDRAYYEYKKNELLFNAFESFGKEGLKHKIISLKDIILYLPKKLVFELIGGYGTKPWNVFVTMVITVLLFAGVYMILPGLEFEISDEHFTTIPTIQKSFYYSGITFLTIGYGDVSPVSEWAQRLSVLEGFLGIFLMSYFTVSFVRKLLR